MTFIYSLHNIDYLSIIHWMNVIR